MSSRHSTFLTIFQLPSLYEAGFLSCGTTQPPQTNLKGLAGTCDSKFKIGDNPDLKLALWAIFQLNALAVPPHMSSILIQGLEVTSNNV